LRRQGWNTSPAEVNYKGSSKTNLLVNNKKPTYSNRINK